jgi:hypothetical protein
LHQFIKHRLRVELLAMLDDGALIFEDIAFDELVGHADAVLFCQSFALGKGEERQQSVVLAGAVQLLFQVRGQGGEAGMFFQPGERCVQQDPVIIRGGTEYETAG